MGAESNLILLSDADARAPWAAGLRSALEQARAAAEARLGLACDDPVLVTTFPDDASFVRYLRARPTEVVAVTRAATGEIMILRPLYSALSSGEQLQVLTHEMAHFVIGRRVKGPIPAWLDEGIAMLTAQEHHAEGAWRLSLAAATGDLIGLDHLTMQVAVGGSAQELAYGESLSITRFLLARDFPAASQGGRDPAPLAKALADPATGPALRAAIWNSDWQSALEAQWRKSLRSLTTWLAALSGSGALWFAVTLLFLVAYWRQWRMNRLAHRRLEARESLEGPAEPPSEYGPESWDTDGPDDERPPP